MENSCTISTSVTKFMVQFCFWYGYSCGHVISNLESLVELIFRDMVCLVALLVSFNNYACISFVYVAIKETYMTWKTKDYDNRSFHLFKKIENEVL